ncbi:MAG: ABC transporter permease, partial [Bacteroidales bacterium]|nr:ABC transporter permease [Bacteroidales bacterium]
MLRNYILTTYRNILRRPGFSLINISGLAIGLAACLIIMLYVFDELSYDRFHEKADRIYRVTVHGKFGANEFHSTYTPLPFAAALKQEFPEVEYVTRLLSGNQHSVRAGENTFIEDRFLYADSSFFEVFSFKLIEGNQEKALVEPKSIVLTKSTAKRYFGDEDPMGKAIIENNIHHYTVTGIVEDAPSNSHFKFNAIASFNSLAWHANTSWFNQSAHTYLVLAPKTNADETEQKLDSLLYRNIREQMKEFLGISLEEFVGSGQTYGYKLQPLTKIHLHSQLDGELEANGNITYVMLFSIIAVFILLIACINYMNLSTAQSTSRAKEVGIRKVLGSSRGDLIRQFLGESILFSLIAMIIAVFLIELSLPFFNQISNKHLSLNFESATFLLTIIPLFVIITGLIAGSYPAFYLSAYQPLQVIKGHLFKGVTKSQLRSLLVLLQY